MNEEGHYPPYVRDFFDVTEPTKSLIQPSTRLLGSREEVGRAPLSLITCTDILPASIANSVEAQGAITWARKCGCSFECRHFERSCLMQVLDLR
jgi:hypothetical protein